MLLYRADLIFTSSQFFFIAKKRVKITAKPPKYLHWFL